MRRWFAIAKATALEMMSEPLSLLLLLTSSALVTLAPALHYHQFGEPTRMACDAGLSSLFVFAGVFAVTGVFRSLRREIKSGTAQMAISRSVSRRVFFLAKFSGALMAYAVFAIITAAVSYVMVCGAAIGGEMARRSGDIARLWGPALAAGCAAVILPLIVAAALNRFWRFRFVLSAFALTFVFSLAAAGCFFDWREAVRLSSAWVPLFFPAAVLISLASALAVSMRLSYAVVSFAVALCAFVPAIGNYYLADSLAKGAAVPWGYVALSAAAALPPIAAFLVLGVHLFERRDIG
jgi:ABC-type transport system involved in multi-copper enzyme maturation permease subunit